MSKVTYPRPCPHCGKVLNNRFSYCRHKAHCGKTTPKVQCLYYEKSFGRLDNCKRHMKNVHSEGAKRKAEEGIAEDELYCFGFYFEAVMRKARKLTHDIPFWFFL